MTYRVRDDGNGMVKEILAQVFVSSFATNRFGKGAGLGLAIL